MTRRSNGDRLGRCGCNFSWGAGRGHGADATRRGARRVKERDLRVERLRKSCGPRLVVLVPISGSELFYSPIPIVLKISLAHTAIETQQPYAPCSDSAGWEASRAFATVVVREHSSSSDWLYLRLYLKTSMVAELSTLMLLLDRLQLLWHGAGARRWGSGAVHAGGCCRSETRSESASRPESTFSSTRPADQGILPLATAHIVRRAAGWGSRPRYGGLSRHRLFHLPSWC